MCTGGGVGQRLKFAALTVALGAATAWSTPARADVPVNRFDSPAEVDQWRFDFGSASHNATFLAGGDANGNPASGAMRVTLGFSPNLGGESKGAYTRDFFPGLNGDNAFTGMEMDLRVDPSSAVDAFGNNGFFQLVIRNTGNYDYNAQFQDNVSSAGGWRHIVVSPLQGAVNDIRAVTFQLYGGPSQNINGMVTLDIDNVVFDSPAVPEPAGALVLTSGLLATLCRRRRR